MRVQFDAGWSKRGYKTYSALSAAMPFIEHSTKKIIHLEIANKYC